MAGSQRLGQDREGIEEMKDFIFDNLGFMSIFLKPQGQEADMIEPLIVKDTSTVRDVCAKLHRDFLRKFRYARVKGPSAKFDWQRVGLDHQLKDEDYYCDTKEVMTLYR